MPDDRVQRQGRVHGSRLRLLRPSAGTPPHRQPASPAALLQPQRRSFIGSVVDPLFDAIRKSPRWAALIKRVGLSDVPNVTK